MLFVYPDIHDPEDYELFVTAQPGCSRSTTHVPNFFFLQMPWAGRVRLQVERFFPRNLYIQLTQIINKDHVGKKADVVLLRQIRAQLNTFLHRLADSDVLYRDPLDPNRWKFDICGAIYCDQKLPCTKEPKHVEYDPLHDCQHILTRYVWSPSSVQT